MVDDRRYDVKDILDKAGTGWITPPNKPALIVEDIDNPFSAFVGKQARMITDGVILIRKGYEFKAIELNDYDWENRLWSFPISIISESAVLLQGIFDQTREVMNRYTSSPWSTSTLGTGTTYRKAKIELARQDERHPHWVMDTQVHLLEQFVAVVIA